MIEIRSQRVARAAFEVLERRLGDTDQEKYLAFARSFPTLVHTCGLAQAVAFARAKGVKQLEKRQVIDDLCQVLNVSGCGWLGDAALADGDALDHQARSERDVMAYLRLTRRALLASTWLKRYAEALMASRIPAAIGSET